MNKKFLNFPLMLIFTLTTGCFVTQANIKSIPKETANLDIELVKIEAIYEETDSLIFKGKFLVNYKHRIFQLDNFEEFCFKIKTFNSNSRIFIYNKDAIDCDEIRSIKSMDNSEKHFLSLNKELINFHVDNFDYIIKDPKIDSPKKGMILYQCKIYSICGGFDIVEIDNNKLYLITQGTENRNIRAENPKYKLIESRENFQLVDTKTEQTKTFSKKLHFKRTDYLVPEKHCTIYNFKLYNPNWHKEKKDYQHRHQNKNFLACDKSRSIIYYLDSRSFTIHKNKPISYEKIVFMPLFVALDIIYIPVGSLITALSAALSK